MKEEKKRKLQQEKETKESEKNRKGRRKRIRSPRQIGFNSKREKKLKTKNKKWPCEVESYRPTPC